MAPSTAAAASGNAFSGAMAAPSTVDAAARPPQQFRWVLGSSSRWRRALFKEYFESPDEDQDCDDASGRCSFASADIDEKAIRHPVAEVMTQKIAKAKAEKIAAALFSEPGTTRPGDEGSLNRPTMLLTLDQVVRFRGEVREKPETAAEARRYLESYRDFPEDWIECVNGFCLCHGGRYITSYEISRVRKFSGLSDATKVDELIAAGDIFHCAGGFVVESLNAEEFWSVEDPPTLGIQGLPVKAVVNLARVFPNHPIPRPLARGPGGLEDSPGPQNRITHFLFDMDGLLLNTEDIYQKATVELCAGYNVEFTRQIREKMIGRRALFAAEIAVNELKLPITPQEFIDQRAALMNEAMKEADFLPGAKELLYKIKDELKMPLALATSSGRPLMMLKTTKVRPIFEKIFGDFIICGDELEGKGKPEPEIFQRALKMISREGETIDPRCVLVFEDAPSGVAAAHAAGMRACMVPDVHLSPHLRGKAEIELESLAHFDVEQFVV